MVIKDCLKKYSNGYYDDMFGFYGKVDTKSRHKAEEFLKSYALGNKDFQQKCLPLMQNVFKHSNNCEFDIRKSSANELFQEGFQTYIHISSPMFTEESYLYIQKICKVCKDEYFYIVEDNNDSSAFQLRIPATTKWENLVSGGFISIVLFNMPYNNYKVFGDSGNWGKWCDYDNPWVDYEIFGTKVDFIDVKNYNSLMELSEKELSYLPEKIKEIMKMGSRGLTF